MEKLRSFWFPMQFPTFWKHLDSSRFKSVFLGRQFSKAIASDLYRCNSTRRLSVIYKQHKHRIEQIKCKNRNLEQMNYQWRQNWFAIYAKNRFVFAIHNRHFANRKSRLQRITWKKIVRKFVVASIEIKMPDVCLFRAATLIYTNENNRNHDNCWLSVAMGAFTTSPNHIPFYWRNGCVWACNK